MFSAGILCAILSVAIGLCAFSRARRKWMLAGPAASFALMASMVFFPPPVAPTTRAESPRGHRPLPQDGVDGVGDGEGVEDGDAVTRLLLRTLARTAPTSDVGGPFFYRGRELGEASEQ